METKRVVITGMGVITSIGKNIAEFKESLETGRHKMVYDRKTGQQKMGSRWWNIWPKRIDYNTYMEVKQLPFFNMSKNKSGFTEEIYNSRNRPFGSLAERSCHAAY